MSRSHHEDGQDAAQEQSSIWSRAFDEVQRARDTQTTPDPSVFRDLTKSAGGD
jgi:hypothetical protein